MNNTYLITYTYSTADRSNTGYLCVRTERPISSLADAHRVTRLVESRVPADADQMRYTLVDAEPAEARPRRTCVSYTRSRTITRTGGDGR